MDADDVVAAQQSLKCQPLLAEEESKPPASVCRGGITSLFCFIARATCSERWILIIKMMLARYRAFKHGWVMDERWAMSDSFHFPWMSWFRFVQCTHRDVSFISDSKKQKKSAPTLHAFSLDYGNHVWVRVSRVYVTSCHVSHHDTGVFVLCSFVLSFVSKPTHQYTNTPVIRNKEAHQSNPIQPFSILKFIRINWFCIVHVL